MSFDNHKRDCTDGPSRKQRSGLRERKQHSDIAEAVSGASTLHIQDPTLLDSRIQCALELLQRSTRRKVQVTDVAARVHLSGSHLRHLFRKQIGMSPLRYVKLLRLRGARELLETTFLSVKEVSSAAGFSDLSHFVRDYKKEYGESPSQTRSSMRTKMSTQPVRNIR